MSSVPTSSSSHCRSLRIGAIVLAGGQGSRVEYQDKGLLQWRGRALVDHVIECVRPQVDDIVISANRHIEQYLQRGFPVITDTLPDFAGPLAGIAACLAHCDADIVLTVPCDMPLLPADLVSRMQRVLSQNNADCVVAHDGSYSQYLVALYQGDVLRGLPAALTDGVRAVRHWQQRIQSVAADFSDQTASFDNFNTLAQLD